MKDDLIECINEIANLPNEDKVNIRGKFYTTVDKRVQVFRKHFGSLGRITTCVKHNDLERVVVEASISICRNNDWEVVGNDYAEEFRSQGPVNKTSALENCCTSAIGRALAACGLGGGEYASSFEVDNAMNNKEEAPSLESGYVLRRSNGTVISHSVDEKLFIKTLRKFIGDPENQDHRELYEVNMNEVRRAYEHATIKKDIEAYAKLIDLYEGQGEEDEQGE